MARAEEENFRVCGLCSQLVDESIQIDNAGLRSFLIHLLSLTNDELPCKICTDCYQGSSDCRKFAERCSKAIAKLRNTKLSDSMILGKSPREKKLIREIEAKVEAAPPVPELEKAVPKAKGKKSGPASKRAPQISTDLIIESPGGRRATRKAVVGADGGGNDNDIEILDEPAIKKSSRGGGGKTEPEQNGFDHPPPPSPARSSRRGSTLGGGDGIALGVTPTQYRSLTAKRNQPKAVIDKVERALADKAFFSAEKSIDYRYTMRLARSESACRSVDH
jgi:hypothetical protein